MYNKICWIEICCDWYEMIMVVWEYVYGMSLTLFHESLGETLCGVCSVCNGIKIQARLHLDTLMDQSNSHRVDWFKWWE